MVTFDKEINAFKNTSMLYFAQVSERNLCKLVNKMYRLPWKNYRKSIKNSINYSITKNGNVDNKKLLPNQADVVIIGK